MKLFKGIAMLLCVIVADMFLFPVELRALLGLNTKKMLAAFALVLLVLKLVKDRELKMDKSFLYISILAGLVSVCGIISVTYNNTTDYAYATYITSCWVWWGGAYTVCWLIRQIHGRATFPLLTFYLAAVCVFQCAIALAIDYNPDVKQAVLRIFYLSGGYFAKGNVQRMFGIGAELDTAGIRFSLVTAMLIYLQIQMKERQRWYSTALFFIVLFFITVVGNMIARTTLVGIVVALCYLAFITLRQLGKIEKGYFALWRWLAIILFIGIPIVTFYYNTNPRFKKNLRFGFEGFFALVEKGHWKVSSNETLRSMYVWPDNPKTWVIGDGYFSNPIYTDPYYTGEVTGGWYKNTDVGYLRFIYYFGMVGLCFFSFYMIEVGRLCAKRYPEWKVLFIMLLTIHFIVWGKVATDSFLIFALFLCLDPLITNGQLQNEDCLSDSRNV